MVSGNVLSIKAASRSRRPSPGSQSVNPVLDGSVDGVALATPNLAPQNTSVSDSFLIQLSDALDASDQLCIGDVGVDAWTLTESDWIEFETSNDVLIRVRDIEVTVSNGCARVESEGGMWITLTFMTLQRLTAGCMEGSGGAAEYIELPTLDEALERRRRFGGWVFATDSGPAFWFGLKYTPFTVASHPKVAGISGKLM